MNNDTVLDANASPIDLDNLKPWQSPKEPLTREQWFRELEVRPATPNQVGTIMSKFQSLGFHQQDERPWYIQPDEQWLGRTERLDIISALTGRYISSTWELKHGEAGKLIKTLADINTLDELYGLLPDGYWQDDTEKRQIPWKGIALVVAGVAVAAL